MKNRIRNGIMVVLLAVYALTPATVSAALMQHLHTSVDPVTGYWGWGDIQFMSEACEDNGSCTALVEAFDYTQEIGIAGEGGYELNFAQPDIAQVGWAINSVTWGLDVFYLTTNWVLADAVGGTTETISGMIDFGIFIGEGTYADVYTCAGTPEFCASNDAELTNYDLHATPVHVPEPTTLALLSLGIAGLGFTRRRMKA